VRRASAIFLALVTAAGFASAGEWQIASANVESLAHAGFEHRHLVVKNNASEESAELDLALFPAKTAHLHVIDNASGDLSLSEAMAQSASVAGVNGGYFDPQFAPIGLRIIDSAITAPLVRARLLTGIVAESRARGVELLRISEFSKTTKFVAAIECGPFVVDKGAPVRGLDDTRRARRTFVITTRNGKAAFGYCDNATLAELGEILGAIKVGDAKIVRALNLDGGSSSAFWFQRGDGSAFSISGFKSVRDFISVSPK
jgi:uncharacterized protein YigE (DUF2233 family)